MNSPNTSSEVDKKAFEQLSGVLERMYYDVKKGLSDLRPYERQIKAIFRKRQDYETHQSEIKGRIEAYKTVAQLHCGIETTKTLKRTDLKIWIIYKIDELEYQLKEIEK